MGDYHNNFDEMERELREGLGTRSAPEGFAERVLARAAMKEVRRETPSAMFWHWRGALAAVLIGAALIAGGVWQRHRQQRSAGEQARAQVMLALRITNNTLGTVLQRDLQQPTKEDRP